MTDRLRQIAKQYSFEEWVSALGFFLMLVIVCLEIFIREVFNISFLWSEAVGRYLMIWSVYFGAAAAVAGRQHLRIDILLNLASARTRAALDVVADLWVLAVSVALTVAGFEFVRATFDLGIVSQDVALPFQLGWVYLVIPVTFALSAIHVVLRFGKAWKNVRVLRAACNFASK